MPDDQGATGGYQTPDPDYWWKRDQMAQKEAKLMRPPMAGAASTPSPMTNGLAQRFPVPTVASGTAQMNSSPLAAPNTRPAMPTDGVPPSVLQNAQSQPMSTPAKVGGALGAGVAGALVPGAMPWATSGGAYAGDALATGATKVGNAVAGAARGAYATGRAGAAMGAAAGLPGGGIGSAIGMAGGALIGGTYGAGRGAVDGFQGRAPAPAYSPQDLEARFMASDRGRPAAPLSQTIGQMATLPAGVANPPAAMPEQAQAQPQVPGFTSTMTPQRRLDMLHGHQSQIRAQLQGLPRDYELSNLPPEQAAAVRANRAAMMNDLHALDAQIMPLAAMVRGPGQVATVAQTNAGRASLQKQYDNTVAGEKTPRNIAPERVADDATAELAPTPQIGFSPFGDRQYQAAVEHQTEEFTRNRTQALADEAPRAMADADAKRRATQDRAREIATNEMTMSQIQANTARAKGEAAGNTPELATEKAKAEIEGVRAGADAAALQRVKLLQQTNAEKAGVAVQGDALKMDTVLSNPQLRKATEDLIPLYNNLAGSRLLPSEENANSATAYEAQVDRLEKLFNALPPDQQDIWRSELTKQLAAHQGGDWLSRAAKSAIYWYSGDSSPNARVNKANGRLFKIVGSPH